MGVYARRKNERTPSNKVPPSSNAGQTPHFTDILERFPKEDFASLPGLADIQEEERPHRVSLSIIATDPT
jgi:hypothetical protein